LGAKIQKDEEENRESFIGFM